MADYDDPENTILIELKDGTVAIQLLPDVAPQHCARMKELARGGEYDNATDTLFFNTVHCPILRHHPFEAIQTLDREE